MDIVDELIADWIRIRVTLKGQLKRFDDGHRMVVPGRDSEAITIEASERLHRCVVEIEHLIAHYSIRD
jgi:hypothetical protein